MNSYSSIKTATKVVTYFDNDFERRKVDFIKNIVNVYDNISEQIQSLINEISYE